MAMIKSADEPINVRKKSDVMTISQRGALLLSFSLELPVLLHVPRMEFVAAVVGVVAAGGFVTFWVLQNLQPS